MSVLGIIKGLIEQFGIIGVEVKQKFRDSTVGLTSKKCAVQWKNAKRKENSEHTSRTLSLKRPKYAINCHLKGTQQHNMR